MVYSTAISFAVTAQASAPIRTSLMSVWLVLIVSSTVLVHQHHLLDVVTAVLLTLLIRRIWEERDV